MSNTRTKRSQRNRIRNCKIYENELCNLIAEFTEGEYYGHRGEHTSGADVYIFKKVDIPSFFVSCMKGEVKTTTDDRLYIKGVNREQFKNYLKLRKETGHEVIYYYRILTHKKTVTRKKYGRIVGEAKMRDKYDKWRVFFMLDNIDYTDAGNPLLDFYKGVPLKQFLGDILNQA
jgi:hypothetical protein